MQTVGDQTTSALKELSIFVPKGVHLFALGIKHSKNLMMLVDHRDNDLGARRVKGGQIARIVPYVANNNGFARFQRSAAQSLGGGKPRIRRRFVTRFRKDDKFVLHDFINADPAIIARLANHFHEFPHSRRRAAAGQRKGADRLQLLACRFFHSRESNLVQKKTSASGISTFRDQPARELSESNFAACSIMMSAKPGSVPMDDA